METGGFTVTGAGFAAISAMAKKGNATKRLFIFKLPPLDRNSTYRGRAADSSAISIF
jgi:hypothetical protein